MEITISISALIIAGIALYRSYRTPKVYREAPDKWTEDQISKIGMEIDNLKKIVNYKK